MGWLRWISSKNPPGRKFADERDSSSTKDDDLRVACALEHLDRRSDTSPRRNDIDTRLPETQTAHLNEGSHSGSTGRRNVRRLSRASGSSPSISPTSWNTTPAAHACGEQATGYGVGP